MPARLPYMQFYPADWCRDTFKLSLAARGAWIDLCCHLWTSDTGEETNTVEEWARLLRSTDVETLSVLTALIDTTVASGVRESNPDGSVKVTIRCRRIFNEKAERKRKREWKASRDGSGKVAATVAAPFPTHSEQSRAEQSQNQSISEPDKSRSVPPATPATPPPKKRFIPPTLEEVTAYLSERKAKGKPEIDPEGFIANYEKTGWKIKGQQITSWKACVITFEKNAARFGTHPCLPSASETVSPNALHLPSDPAARDAKYTSKTL